MRISSCILCALIGVALIHASAAAKRELRFDHISIDDGLSQGRVLCIAQDSIGYVWIGTQNGLNRYDGYDFTVFVEEPFDSTSLSDNKVTCILPAPDGDLWIGTGLGLNYFKHRTETFVRFTHDASDSTTIRGDHIYDLVMDRGGNTWIATSSGLDRYDKGSGAFVHVDASAGDAHRGSPVVYSLAVDTANRIWLGIDRRVVCLDANRGSVDEHPVGDGSTLDPVLAIVEDRSGDVWAAGSGLYRFDRSESRFIRCDTVDRRVATRSIMEDARGCLWLCTHEGLLVSDASKRAFDRYSAHPDDPAALVTNGINVAFEDRGGNVWLGTNGYGVHKWTPLSSRFHNVPLGSRMYSVRAINEDRDGTLWVGGYGPLMRIPPFGSGAPEPMLESFYTYCMLEDPDQPDRYLWLGSDGRGLTRLDRRSRSVVDYPYSAPPGDATAQGKVLAGAHVYAMCPRREGGLWLATEVGLSHFIPSTGEFVYHEGVTSTDTERRAASSLLNGRDGTLWVGTQYNGIAALRPDGHIDRYRNHGETSDHSRLSEEHIKCVFEDSQGRVWVGTNGGGLSLLLGDGRFRHFTTRDGLPDNVVYGILEDAQGRLWMSTNHGLSRFDPETKIFRNYVAADGLQSNEFNTSAYHMGRSGRMYFGGIHGLTSFFADQVEDNTVPPTCVISEVTVQGPDGSSHHLSADELRGRNGPIEFGHGETYIEIHYVGLDYGDPKRVNYMYRLSGVHAGWQDVDDNRVARLWGLRPGRYRFAVRASNSDGVWSDEPASFSFIISPPFRATTWFRALVVFVFLAALGAAHRLRTTMIRRRAVELDTVNRRLRREIEARTDAESDLRRTSEHLRVALEATGVGVWEWNFASDMITWPGVPDSRYGLDDFVQRRTSADAVNLVHPEDRERVVASIETGRHSDVPVDVEYRSESPSGEICWLHCKGVVIRNSRGDAVGMTGTIQNVTERRRTLEALEASEAYHRGVIEDQTEFIVRWKLDGTRTFVNDAYCRFFGITREDALGTSFRDLVPEADWHAILERVRPLTPESPVVTEEHRAHRPDGTLGWQQWTTRAIFDDSGRLIELQSIGRDVTDRHRAEESSRQARFSIDQSPEGVFWFGPDARFAYANEAACRSLGYSREELIGMRVFDIAPNRQPDRWSDLWERLKAGGTLNYETRHRRRDGSTFPVDLRITYGIFEGREYGFGIARDITERKRAEEQLLASREQLRVLAMQLSTVEERERRSLATYVHDQIGQKLAVLRMRTSALMEASKPDELAKVVDDIRDLLDKTIADTRTLSFDLSPPVLYDLGLGAAVEWEGERLCKQHRLAFEFTETGSHIHVDPDTSAQLFRGARELLMNVVKHAGASRVEATVVVGDETVKIMIADDGVGFDADKTLSRFDGAGFGLVSIRERMTYIGGYLDIDSRLGKGTMATLIAPTAGKAARPSEVIE